MKRFVPLPSKERLLERFSYDAESGVLNRLVGLHRGRVGALAGFKNQNGYIVVQMNGVKYQAHRVIWCMMTGDDPGDMTIDHQDGDRSNNRFANLRLASHAQQNYNKRACTLGSLRGVTPRPFGRFEARIRMGGHQRHLGYFGTAEEANAAYESVARRLHGEFYARAALSTQESSAALAGDGKEAGR